jgi:hypothetical protein
MASVSVQDEIHVGQAQVAGRDQRAQIRRRVPRPVQQVRKRRVAFAPPMRAAPVYAAGHVPFVHVIRAR